MKSPFDFTREQINSSDDESMAAAYLIALAFSPWQYHIDDDPHDIIWSGIVPPSDSDLCHLKSCTDAACMRLDRHTGIINDGAWVVYSAALLVAGKSD